jgi:hypothetical protein
MQAHAARTYIQDRMYNTPVLNLAVPTATDNDRLSGLIGLIIAGN